MTSMKQTAAILAATLSLTLGVCLLFNTPLFRYFGNSITCSYRMAGTERRQHMVPGDSLQLLYEFLLLKDSVFGTTPLFEDPYEFNPGTGANRHAPSCYAMVFSLIFALLDLMTTAAIAWNLTFLLTLWLTAYFSWRLAERYTSIPAFQAMAALIAILIPYRFMALCGGSPTGFAAAWTPLLLLGLDRFIRNNSLGSACVAGLALIFLAMGDIQTFFFAALAAPAWCIVSLVKEINSKTFRWPWLRARLAPALIIIIAAGVSFLIIRATTRLGSSIVSKGRALWEIGLFTPHAEGLVNAAASGVSSQIYLGWPLFAIIAIAFIFLLFRLATRPSIERARNAVVFLLLAAAIFLIIALALGPFGPFGSWLFVAARDHLPYYRMLRQTAKIFALLPAFLPLVLVVGLQGALGARPRPAVAWLAAILVAGTLTFDYQRLFRPMVCELALPSPAYAALVNDSLANGETPRALAIPLWPGDHHSGSIYQYFAINHHVRMLNGYRPAVPGTYLADIFTPFESLNQGIANDAQLDNLLSRGVRHLVFHEELYVAQISPFPGYLTLDRLLQHPRLALLAHDNTIRVFSILSKPADSTVAATTLKPTNPIIMPRLPIFTDNLITSRVEFVAAPDAAGKRFASLLEPGAWLNTPDISFVDMPDPRWLIRIRGHGEILVTTVDLNTRGLRQKELPEPFNPNQVPASQHDVSAVWSLSSLDWEWRVLSAASNLPCFGAASLRIECITGKADVDAIMPVAGAEWEFPANGKLTWTACEAFHNSESVSETGEVRIKSGLTREGPVLAAIHWPLMPDRYSISIYYRSEEPNMRLGGFVVEGKGLEQKFTHVDVISTNTVVTIDVTQKIRLPVTATLHYAGRGNFIVESITLERLSDAP